MQEEGFKDFLKNHTAYEQSTCRDYIYQCKRIERDLKINLDDVYEADKLVSMTKTVTTDYDTIPIRGNRKKGIGSLKSVVLKYKTFREHHGK